MDTRLHILAWIGLTSALSGQQTLSVTVADSKSPNFIGGAIVEEMATQQLLTTDPLGEGQFANEVPGDSVTIFKVSKQGFPDHYFQRIWPDLGPEYDNPSHQVFALTQAREFVSPIMGPAGGAKTVNLPTGIMIYQGAGDPNPVEYTQELSAELSAGALTGNYRVGFSVIPGAGQAENNVNLQQLGPETQIVAQFRMEWLDTSGNPVVAPVLGEPLQVSMSPSTYIFDQELPGSWTISLHRFDEATLTWIEMPAGSSGVDSEGMLWADVADNGYYSFMAWSSELVTSSLCTTEWHDEKWYGVDEDEADVTCAGGAQQHLNINYGGTESTKIGGHVTGRLATKLKLMGLKSEASVEVGLQREDYWGTFQAKDYGWNEGAYAGQQGTIYLRAKGYILTLRKICVSWETGEEVTNEILDSEGPIKTGYAVRKDLTDCP